MIVSFETKQKHHLKYLKKQSPEVLYKKKFSQKFRKILWNL